MRCACVDIGTNTTRLLVAERTPHGLHEVVAVRRFLRLPTDDGAVPLAAARRLAATVAAHTALARDYGAVRVRVVATAAIRGAANRDELCAAVRAAAGLPVEVLSDDEEAALAFAGATLTLPEPPAGLVGVVDVGGGSSELVAGTVAEGATWWASLGVGSGVLADRHLRSDPPTEAELEAMRADVTAAFAAVRAPAPLAAYAVGGSATSIARLAGEVLDAAALRRAHAALAGRPVAEAARRLDLHPERVRLLPAGLMLLEAGSAAFGGVPLRMARGGVREGVVLHDLGLGSRRPAASS